MYCEHCGHSLSDTANFCPNCGAKVTTSPPMGDHQPDPGQICPDGPSAKLPFPDLHPQTRDASTLSDLWLYSLSFSPVGISFACNCLHMPWLSTACVCLVVTAFFLFLDLSELKSCGYDTTHLAAVGILIYPVYLFMRASRTNKNYAPAVLFFFVLVFFSALSSGVL